MFVAKIEDAKADVEVLKREVATLERQLQEEQAALAAATNTVASKEDQIQRNEAEIASCRDDIARKVEEIEKLDRGLRDTQLELSAAHTHSKQQDVQVSEK